MTSPRLAVLLVVLVGAVSDVCAQESPLESLKRAAVLNDTGQFRAVVELVEPLLGSNSQKLGNAVAGVAWNMRGLALQNLGNRDEARRSYESAIKMLRDIPDQTVQYATALDNLGSLEAEEGQLKESEGLRIRAKELYNSVGDHAGVARSASSLSVVALALGSRKEAHHYLADAHREEGLVSTPDSRDLAWMSGAECLLDEAEGKFQAALDQVNRVVDLWTHQFGPKYYLLSSAFFVRGRLHHVLRDDAAAAEDLRYSLMLLSNNNEENSRLYFLTKIMYAKVLRNSGKKDDASRMESDATAALERLNHQQCRGCTISAEGIR